MPSMSCDKKCSHSEQRCNTDIILEIKNCITQIVLTQGQICQFNTHLLVTEETSEANSPSAAHHSRTELLSRALRPKEFSTEK